MDKNHILNYVILIASIFFTVYPLLTMQVTTNDKGNTSYEISSVVFIAPILGINAMFQIIFEEKIIEFRSQSKRIMYALFCAKVFDKIEEGRTLTREWINRKP